MSRQQIEHRVLAIVESYFDVIHLSPRQSLVELSGDSMDAMYLVLELEEEFEISIPTSEYGRMLGPISNTIDLIEGLK